ncbi:carboxypeptidase-like regulatory domain-containing protein [Pseudarcicella hirudinis]|uniref:carboxypeptidase-like regulatory domain-containing protein n=1 Tax=Pseudarcicella hirudinis TaxID=1079859 RepID=UPI0035EED1F2
MIQKHLPQKRGMIPSPHLLFRKRTEMFTHFLLLFFLFFSTVTLAQNTRISGKVTDKKGVPIPGVNVKIKGSSAGSATDADGIYSLNASRGGSSLVFLLSDIPQRKSRSMAVQQSMCSWTKKPLL